MTNLSGTNPNRIRILGISGSLRKGSFNTGLLRAAQELASDGMEIAIFDLKDIPLYNGDVEAEGDPAVGDRAQRSNTELGRRSVRLA